MKKLLWLLLFSLLPIGALATQGSVVIGDGTGAQVLTAINTAHQVLISDNAGASAPTTTYAYQRWADTTAGVMKQRNAANSAWLTLYTLATPDTGRTFATTTLLGTTTNTGATINGGTISGVVLSATTGAFSDTVTSTKSCASGYTRRTPNYCSRSSSETIVLWTESVACTARTTGMSLPAGTQSVFIRLIWRFMSSGTAGTNLTNDAVFYNSTICSAALASASSLQTQYEWAAVTAGTIVGVVTDHLIVPLVATDTFYAKNTNAGGNGTAEIAYFIVEGYFD